MIVVRTYPNSVVTVRGTDNARVKVQNAVQRVKVVQSVSPIPLIANQNEIVDGGNF